MDMGKFIRKLLDWAKWTVIICLNQGDDTENRQEKMECTA